jgi:co-chaperonin GroES (HSP10)
VSEPELDLSAFDIIMPRNLLQVKQLPPKTKIGGILLPDAAKEGRCVAEVISVSDAVAGKKTGIETYDTKWAVQTPILPGDFVIVLRTGLNNGEYSELGEKLSAIADTDVLTILRPKK